MKKEIDDIDLPLPKSQLNLYGYDLYLNLFSKLYKENNLPKNILLSGPKGSGKATFAYHFINYILSQNEVCKYSLQKKSINENSVNFNSILNETNPNFFLIENNGFEENIKIEKVRN